MLRSWRIGTAFGIPLYIHWSFLLLIVWVLFMQAGGDAPFQTAFMLAFVLMMFGCIMLHELGHAMMARAFNIRTRDITLYPIGGVARLESTGRKPGEELLIAIAGPAVNVAIIMLLAIPIFAMLIVDPNWLAMTVLGRFLVFLAVGNAFIVGFNMLPAFPMDGGRVFRALLSYMMGQLRATRIAVWVGGIFAILGLVVGISAQQPFLAVISVFLFFAGQQELRAIEMKEQGRFARSEEEEYFGSDGWRPRSYRNYDAADRVPNYASPNPRPLEPSDFAFQPKISVYEWDSKNNRWVKQ